MNENRFLTPRLLAILEQVSGCRCLGDVGTDHAYIPIAAVRTNRADFAYATDIHKGPVEKALNNVALHGLSDRIEVRLGGGFTPLLDTAVDTVVVAGMGGNMIKEILNEYPDFTKNRLKLILQPMREVHTLRSFLRTQNLLFKENLVREDRRFYHIVTVFPQEQDCVYEINEWDVRFGIRWLRKDELWLPYLKRTAEELHRIENGIVGENPSSLQRKETCRQERMFLQELIENHEII